MTSAISAVTPAFEVEPAFGCCAKSAGHTDTSTIKRVMNLLLIAYLLLKLSFNCNGLASSRTRRADCLPNGQEVDGSGKREGCPGSAVIDAPRRFTYIWASERLDPRPFPIVIYRGVPRVVTFA